MAWPASKVWMAALAVAGSMASVAPANARTPWSDIEDLPKEQRLAAIVSKCGEAVNAGSQEARFWCDRAWLPVILTRMDARKAEVIFNVRWVAMVETRREGTGISTKKAVAKRADPRLAEAQALTFDAALLRSGFSESWDSRVMERLAVLIDHEPVTGNLTDQRLALLKAINAAPRDEASLWVTATLAATWAVEYPSVTLSRDQVQAYARSMIDLLTPLLADARQARGSARALYPLIALNLVDLLGIVGDNAGASRTAREAAAGCQALLWTSNALCLDLDLASSMSRARAQIIAAHPEREGRKLRAPVVVKGSLTQESTGTDGQSCRVAILFDLDPSGAVINVRIIHSAPANGCNAVAIGAISRLQYEPLTASTPETVRTDLLQAIVIKGE